MHPACPNKEQNHLQNSLLRRTQFWVRKTFSKPASLKRASLVPLLYACRTPCVQFSLLVWPARLTTSEVDAATKLLDKACQKLQGIQNIPSQRVTDLEATIQSRSLYVRHVSTSFLDPVFGTMMKQACRQTLKSLAAECLVGVRLGLLNFLTPVCVD